MYRLIPSLVIAATIAMSFLLGVFLNPDTEAQNMEEMLRTCGTTSYYDTPVRCIQKYLMSKGDLHRDPRLYDVWCGGDIIGRYACY